MKKGVVAGIVIGILAFGGIGGGLAFLNSAEKAEPEEENSIFDWVFLPPPSSMLRAPRL